MPKKKEEKVQKHESEFEKHATKRRRKIVLTGNKNKKQDTLKQALGQQVVQEKKGQLVGKRANGTKVVLLNADPLEALRDLATINGYEVIEA